MYSYKKWVNLFVAFVLVLSLWAPAKASANTADAAQLSNEETANYLDVKIEIQGLHSEIKPLTTISVEEGKTALDAVKQVMDASGITYTITDSAWGAYVEAINGLSAGTLNGWDGWSFKVNGIAPEVGIGSYTLAQSDQVTVYYSKYPVLSATAEGQIITIDLIGDVFTEQATAIENWNLIGGVAIQSIEKISNQQVKLTIATPVTTVEVKALAGALSSGQETSVTLEDAAVAEVIQLIAALPTIEEAHETNQLALEQARAKYDALTAEQQAQVINIQELTNKENAFKTLNQVTVKINLRVEGITGTVINLKDFVVTGEEKVTAAEATKQALDANGVDYDHKVSSDYFKSIAGEAERELGAGSGWMYKVNGTYPDVYSSAITLKDGDEVVWDYINSFSLVEDYDLSEYIPGYVMYSGAESVDKVTFNPIIDMPTVVEAGEDVRISVTGKYNQVSYIYQPISGPHTFPLADVSIEYNGNVYVTDSQGEAIIPGKAVQAGTYELRFTKDLPGTIFKDDGNKELDSFPRIIRTYKQLEVIESARLAAAEQALERAKAYLLANKGLVSEHVNSSHSGFWMLTAMTGAGIDVATYPWVTSPTTPNTFWTTALTAPANTSNEIAGILIGAKALGLDPTNVKGRNQINDLLAKQNSTTQLFSTVWGEAFSLIALDITEASYEKQKHIDAILKLQDEQTGYIGDMDSTGWVLFALAPYMDQPNVKAAINKAVASYYKAFHEQGFIDNANTMAAMISGLASVGENVFSSKWTYEKDDQKVNIVDHLITNYVMADGGVRWKAADTQSNLMALEQVYIALVDAVNGQSTFASLKGKTPTAPAPTEVSTNPSTPNTGEGTVVPAEQVVYVTITNKSTGDILTETAVKVNKDDTAFSVLQRITNNNNIELNVRSTSYGNYIVGIGGVKEFDRGPQSGWMYKVNGNFPTESANTYKVGAGDYMEWVYTENLGQDVGGSSGNVGSNSGGSNDDSNVDNNSGSNDDSGDIKDGVSTLETSISAEKATQNTPIIIQDNNGGKVEIPVAMLKALQLKENETLNVAVKRQDKQIQVTLEKEIEGKKSPVVVAGKNYVKVTLPVTASANTVLLQLVNGEYKAVPHKVVDGQIVILTKTSGAFVVTEETVTFNDITQAFNKEEIEFLASRHIIKGVNANEFKPDDSITRSQFAVMISRALGLQASDENTFSDTTGKWYEREVQALFEAGITNGKSANTFDPEANITRQEAAALMARVLAYVGFQTESSKESHFNDISAINGEFKQYIDLLNNLNIMTGNGDGIFDPFSNLTRAQMAKILKRTLNVADLM